jgi:hypothetical protein
MDDLFEQLRDMQRTLDALPPQPARFRAHHSVPYGRIYRQWNTRGELEIWINRGLIADLPRAKAELGSFALFQPSLTGIPVVNG